MQESSDNPNVDVDAPDQSSKPKSATEEQGAVFFSVGLTKLLILSILSFHYYSLVWMYKNWKYLRDNRGRSVQPILRSIFSPLFVWQLFAEISETVVEKGGKPPFVGPPIMAIFYIICAVSSNYCSRYIHPLLSFLVLAAIIPTVLIQVRVNELNKLRAEVTNTRLTIWNWIFVVLSVIYWGMFVLSSLA